MMDEREVLNARQVQDIKIPINWEMMKKLYIYSPRRDLNSWPLVYKTSALTTELRRPVTFVAVKVETYLSSDTKCVWK